MSTAELKIDLINRIANLKEAHLVKEIQRLLDFEIDEGVYKFSKEQKQRIVEARKEYADDKVLSEAQANFERKEILEYWINRNKSKAFSFKLN